ncbi:MAG: paraquat-inducible protein A [Deltaproteobacteria bacterium]
MFNNSFHFINRHSRALGIFIIILSAFLLICAFYFPFIKSSFSVDFPDWLPNWFGVHEEIEKWIIKKGRIPEGNQYLLGIIKSLFEDGSIFLGIIIFLFSVVFPVLKIALCAAALSRSRLWHTRSHNGVIKTLGYVSKWSMADVFIVALIIVMFKAKGFNFSFTAEAGLYCYAVSAILSSLCIVLIMHRSDSLDKV